MHITHSGIRFTLLAFCFYILMKDVLHTQQRQFVEVNKVDCFRDENGENGNYAVSSIGRSSTSNYIRQAKYV